MIKTGEVRCSACGGELKYYDKVKRIVRTQKGYFYITIRRLKCQDCGVLHRELPEWIIPYKHYEADIIEGVVEGYITPSTLGFEDYPCEMTMSRWIKLFYQK